MRERNSKPPAMSWRAGQKPARLQLRRFPTGACVPPQRIANGAATLSTISLETGAHNPWNTPRGAAMSVAATNAMKPKLIGGHRPPERFDQARQKFGGTARATDLNFGGRPGPPVRRSTSLSDRSISAAARDCQSSASSLRSRRPAPFNRISSSSSLAGLTRW